MAPGYPATLRTLSPRLAAVAARLEGPEPVADVGTDHGRLALHLAASRPGRRVYALDRSSRALAVARRHLEELDPHDRAALSLSLHRGEGLLPLAPGTVSAVAVAGMGGHSVAGILRGAAAHLPHLRRLVLQPNDHVPTVRSTLHALGLPLVAETVVWERGRPYAILVAEGPPRGELPRPEAAAFLVGPCLAEAPEPGVDRWLAREVQRLEAVLAAARAGGAPPPDEATALLGALRSVRARRAARLEREHAPEEPGSSA